MKEQSTPKGSWAGAIRGAGEGPPPWMRNVGSLQGGTTDIRREWNIFLYFEVSCTSATPAPNIYKGLLKNCHLFCNRDSLTCRSSWREKGKGVGGVCENFMEGPICYQFCCSEVFEKTSARVPGSSGWAALNATAPILYQEKPLARGHKCVTMLISIWQHSRCHNMCFLKNAI